MRALIRLAVCAFALAFAAPAFAQSDDETQSPNEIDRILAQIHTERALAEYQGQCDLPAASAREQIVLLSVEGSPRIANVTFGRQQDLTRVVDIEIERGRAPIYLIVTDPGATIWRFTGATRRLRTLVVVGGSPSGYVGARPRTYANVQMASCFAQFGGPDRSAARIAAGIVERELGRAPDVVAWQTQIEMSIPAGVLEPPPPLDGSAWPAAPPAPPGFDRGVWEGESLRVAEIVMLDPEDVRGAPVTRIELMPGIMGMAQLTGAGALEALPYANDGWRNFRVLRSPLILPPNVTFDHYTIRLYLPAGTPFPEGNLRGVCLVDEVTGDWVGPIVDFCRERDAWMRENIERDARNRRAQ